MDGLDAADRDLLRRCLPSTLAVMTWLAVAYPEAERVGVLRIPTTRGDRLFISLILAAVIHLLWIGFVGTDTIRDAADRERALRFRACGSPP